MSTTAPHPTLPAAAGDAAYDAHRGTFNTALDQRPAHVARPASVAEVADAVRFAAARGLRVAPQATGHNAAPLGDLGRTLLLRTDALQGVTVDPAARRARVLAGTRWEAVVDAAVPHGLTALHGSSPGVGVVGYSLGGGLSWMARRHGLQASHVTAVELVLASGEAVRVDAGREPDLFWAVRGGGGGFGVVTAIEFDLVPVTQVHGGALVWDVEDAAHVVPGWVRWAQEAPDAVTTSLRQLAMPDVPAVPPPLRGRRIVMVDGAVLGDPAKAAEALAPLRALAPELDLFGPMPAAGLLRLHGDPEEPLPYATDTALVGALDDAGADAFVAAGRPDGPLMFSELRQLGGAVSRPAAGGGATDRLDGAFCAFALSPDPGPAGEAATAAVVDALAPWSTGGAYLNFAERPRRAGTLFAPATLARLRAIRAAVDPDGVLHSNHDLGR